MMNKKNIKILMIFLVFIASILLLTITSNAATLSINTSKSTVSPGETFEVTVTLDGGAGPINATTSNGSGSGSQWLENNSLKFSCTAGNSGTVTISASGTVGDFEKEEDVTVSAKKSVTIKQPEQTSTVVPEPETPATQTPTTPTKPSNSITNNNTKTNTTQTEKKSSNSKLASLQIAEGAITPEFEKNVYEYAITVPNEITKLSISASQDYSRATVKITGNEELQVGDNTIEIIVTAEDGSTSTYKIYATRALPELNLATLEISYTNENNENINIELKPQFVSNIYEYTIKEKLSYIVKKLQVKATANRDNAKIEIIGNEELKTGKNKIIIEVKLQNENGLEEYKTYTIMVEKEAEPVAVSLTTMQKITNWFSGVGSAIGNIVATNFKKIIQGMLVIATMTLIGLTIYFAIDYKKYQKILELLAEYNKENLKERVNVALNPEILNEEIKNDENIEKNNKTNIKGKRFK